MPFRAAHDAAALLPLAECVASEWYVNYLGFPSHTAAGIAAAGAGDWSRSEEHHRTAIAQMDGAGYKLGSAIAHIRYADMLLMRRAGGDLAAARDLLDMALHESEAIGLALYAREARKKLECA